MKKELLTLLLTLFIGVGLNPSVVLSKDIYQHDLVITDTFVGSHNTESYVVITSDRTYEYDSNDDPVEDYLLVPGSKMSRGVATDQIGSKVWVLNNNHKVFVYDGDGNKLGVWTVNDVVTPEGIATDGNDIWIVDRILDKVFRYAGAALLTSGSANATDSFALETAKWNVNSRGISTDGTYIWVVNNGHKDSVYKYTVDGIYLGRWIIDSANATPTGITIDPTGTSDSVWIVDSTAKKVFEYADAVSRTSGSQAASVCSDLVSGNTNPQGIALAPPTPQLMSLN